MQSSTPAMPHAFPETAAVSMRPSRLRALSLCCLALSVLFYAAAPLQTLWDAARGLRDDDIPALREALDWKSVRAGMKQDFGAAPGLALAAAQPEDELPAFGDSFATTVASHAIDQDVTPENLVSMLGGASAPAAAGGWRAALARVRRLAFTGPASFEAAFAVGPGAPLLVSLRLSRWQWKITRVHLPDDAAGSDAARTDRT